ncbi:LSU ribosomal protein L4P [Desulfocicer vacuolatum DSM 3385]|uniref:Large ribosomal subunit protein uL4 n=1 Tax=Desulfocicer vacuolatum DSM 3385 TaxID=1121400 RepID=A0A1W1YJG3_9BACT|nr:50S ribosomal protein L4 [Desulfocicer vacuolatum]SMC35921.1 LSU ribosomal protein L4P [Desulfocicer vacuolatum DSM 3385]
MAAVDVLNRSGEKVSEAQLPDTIFSIPVKKSVLHDVVRMQLASRRRGTAVVKGRSDIAGSTKKLYRQKGTGNARSGSIKSPLRRGGGVIFGPTQRSYAYNLPKKVRALALKMALSSKLATDSLRVIDGFGLEEIKTKAFVDVTRALGLKKVLVVTSDDDRNLFLSSRNVPGVKVIKTEGLNVYDILKYDKLLLVESSIQGIEGRLG